VKSTVKYKGRRFPQYEVTTDGMVYRKDKKEPLHGFDDDRGYDCVDLMNNSERCRAKIHLIVAHTFMGNQKPGYVVEHKDGNKKNNKLSNLEYTSQQENVKRAQILIRNMDYLDSPRLEKILKLRQEGKTIGEISDILDVKPYIVRDFLLEKTYQNIL